MDWFWLQIQLRFETSTLPCFTENILDYKLQYGEL